MHETGKLLFKGGAVFASNTDCSGSVRGCGEGPREFVLTVRRDARQLSTANKTTQLSADFCDCCRGNG